MGDHRIYRDHNYELGSQLLLLRTRVALTQLALAEQLGVHRRSVQNWETGLSYPKAETLQRLIAIFLHQHAFTPGTERAEAQALWNQAAQDRPYQFPAFDEHWFAYTLAQNGTINGEGGAINDDDPPSSFTVHRSSFVDWGEAIAVPTLYGRDSELATLEQWAVEDRCRVIAIVGIGGLGKSSLAITFGQQALPQFEVVLFRSLQNGPPLAEILDQIICAVADQPGSLPDQVSDKIALLVQRFRERRCLLVLDNLESIMQPGALTGTYRTGYAEYGVLLHALSEREHQSCLVLTSREKPAELGPLEGRTTPVRSLTLSGLADDACRIILASKEIDATADDLGALTRLYGGNPLALQLIAEPIRELFGGDTSAFLAAGDAFFNGVGKLLDQQLARSTPVEQAILYWLAIERELVPISALLAKLGEAVPRREVLAALESLRRRLLIERAVDQPALALQPVILEFLTDQLVGSVYQEIVTAQPRLLLSHACIQATAKDYVRGSQERLIAEQLLERLLITDGSANAVERQLLAQLNAWRSQPLAAQGYGPGNLINLLRLLRGDLRQLNLSALAIRQAAFQGMEMQDSGLAGALLQDTV